VARLATVYLPALQTISQAVAGARPLLLRPYYRRKGDVEGDER
jgi:hypothetical protein